MEKIEYIVNKAKQGEIRAFEELVHTHETKLYKTARAILDCEDDINEAIQQSIILMYNNINQLKNNKYFSTWFIRILINECKKIYNFNEKQKVKIYELNENLLETTNEDCSFVNTALNKLDKEFREIVILYYYDDFSVNEISDILGIPKGTIKSRLARAREKLKRILEEEGEYIG